MSSLSNVCLHSHPKSEEPLSAEVDQSYKVRRYEISAINMGIKARMVKRVTMEMMLNFFAFFENSTASRPVDISALTEYVRASIPMQEIPQMMLQMASFLWCSSLQKGAASCLALQITTWLQVSLFSASPVPGIVVSGISSSLVSFVWGESDISDQIQKAQCELTPPVKQSLSTLLSEWC